MFRGLSALNLDDKGRLALPSKYRERLSVEESGDMVVTVDLKKCLLLYPTSEWEIVEERFAALPAFDVQAQAVKSLYTNFATEVKLDKGGRILIPQVLREHAQLDKKVFLSGQGKKFEIWSEENWNEDLKRITKEVGSIDWANVSDSLKQLSI